ncbi:MAG TPA: nitrile hydratase subunit alpha, partial [Candidatus Binataceae bacterium]|nr:nitrile hydratase subunit alpha [Candidatus Binataceae bacterium]
EFGLELGPGVEVRVWDSSAEMRYMVLPMRPHGTDHLSEQELASIVTRDAMIGTAIVEYPRDKASGESTPAR